MTRTNKFVFAGLGLTMFIAASLGSLPARAFAGSLPLQNWPMYQFKSDHNAVFDSPDWDASWTLKLGGKINGGLSIVGQTLYVESFDKKVQAIDALTGKILWTSDLPNIAMNSPLVANGVVLVGTGSNHILYDLGEQALIGIPGGDYIYALDAKTGAKLWTFNVPGEAMPTGVLSAVGNVPAFIFAAGDGYLRALRITDGQLLWQTKFPGFDSMGSLATDGNEVIGASLMTPKFSLAAYNSGQVSAIAHQSWTWAANTANGNLTWISPFGWGDCSPTIAQGSIFIEGLWAQSPTAQQRAAGGQVDTNKLQARVYSLDAAHGSKTWDFNTPELGPPTGAGSLELAIAGLHSGGVFFDSLEFSKEFAAFDDKSGALLWKIHTEGPIKMSAIERHGLLYVGDTAGYFYVIDARNGSIRAKIHFPQIFSISPPIIVGRTLFVASNDTVYALRLEDLDRGEIPGLAAR